MKIARRRMPPSEWESWDDERLLDLRLSDLDLSLQDGFLAERLTQLGAELREAGLVFEPHFWLSDEWFTPDGIPGIALPFYLAHPRLMRLEHAQMLEVEGGTPDWCMRILRHEAGHALENAYLLRRRRARRRLFGRTSQPYPDSYAPKPYSRSYVLHLEAWYAQSHPDEDFAETFAVWLAPGSDWRRRYAGWPALRKLRYVDEVMHGLAGRSPLVTTRRTVDPLPSLQRTLRTHYRRRRAHYRVDARDGYDTYLFRLFGDPSAGNGRSAARFLERIRRDSRQLVRRFTGQRMYLIDQVLGDMIERSRQLGLRLTAPEEQVRLEFNVLLTVQIMSALQTGRDRVPL
jgi:Putative zinc-binding metallo-peptidase